MRLVAAALCVLVAGCLGEGSIETATELNNLFTCSDSECLTDQNELNVLETTTINDDKSVEVRNEEKDDLAKNNDKINVAKNNKETNVKNDAAKIESDKKQKDKSKSDQENKGDKAKSENKTRKDNGDSNKSAVPPVKNNPGQKDNKNSTSSERMMNETKSHHHENGRYRKMVKPCICDLMKGVCDVNCCCDEDCTSESKAVFSHCSDILDGIHRTDYCFRSNLVFRNNTAYKTFNLRPGLLCIAKDNLPDTIKYYTHKVINTEKKILNVLKKKDFYNWKPNNLGIGNSDFVELDNHHQYKVGSPVWIMKNISTQLNLYKLSIETEGLSSLCDTMTLSVRYLEDIETSCLVKQSLNRNKNQLQDYTDMFVLVSPQYINSTTQLKDLDLTKIFYKINVYTCLNKTCSNMSLNELNNFRVVKVEYSVVHNGTLGVVRLNCFLHLSTEPFYKTYYRRYFTVKFSWLNQSVELTRSGKPSYIVGKPLLSGYKNDTVIVLSKNMEDWIGTVASDGSGRCAKKRNNIVFGYNVRSECVYEIEKSEVDKAENCTYINHKIRTVLYGVSSDVWISSWGDGDSGDLSSWIQLLTHSGEETESDVSCDNILTSVSYKFIYTMSGTLEMPQTKLIGAMVSDSRSELDKMTCSSNKCLVKLNTDVMFTTVTSVHKLVYPKQPVLRLYLPKDFFYPFSSSSYTVQPYISLMLLLAVIVVEI